MTQEEYKREAAKCVLLAAESNEIASKLFLMGMAQAWMRLAHLAEKNCRTDLPDMTPRESPDSNLAD